MPVIPDSDYQFQASNRIIPRTYGQGYSDRARVRLIGTGPLELYESQLNPPQMINNMPVFSVRVENNITALSIDNFSANVDFENVRVSLSGNDVSFTPASMLNDGEHRAELRFMNPDGYPLTFTWKFKIVSTPPEISVVFLNDYGGAIVFFDRHVEPAFLTDMSRWKLNGYQGILESKIQILNIGDMIVQFAFSASAFDALRSIGSATLTFTDKTGTSDYELNVSRRIGRGGESCDPCDYNLTCADCENVEFCICDNDYLCGIGEVCKHEPLENEDYAIVWQAANPDGCNLELQLIDVIAIPVLNSDLENLLLYDQDEDDLSEGSAHRLCDPTQPLLAGPYYLPIYDDKLIGTLKFPHNWKHNISWVLKCRYCWNDGDNCAHYETSTADFGNFIFNSAFDDTNPDFPDLLDLGITASAYPNPVVMYGYELADYLEEIFTNVPLYDDAGYPDPPFDIHCYSKKRYELEGSPPYFDDGVLDILREWYPCDLFVFAAGWDEAPVDHYHPENINHKLIFPVLGLQVYTVDENGVPGITWNGISTGTPHFEHLLAGTLGWKMDFKPWGSPVLWDEGMMNYPADYEIYTEWEDSTWEEVPDCTSDPDCPPGYPGWLKQDYMRTELAFQWWNISELLAECENFQEVDIRVVLEDEVKDPINTGPNNDGLYNWCRSENVVEQICWFPTRGGGRHAAGDETCNYIVTTEFVNDNPYDIEDPYFDDKQLKRVHYSGETNYTDTSFIYLRDDNGEAKLDYYIAINPLDLPSAKSDLYPDEILVKFFSSESEIPVSMEDTHTGADCYAMAKICSKDPSFLALPLSVRNRIITLVFHTDAVKPSMCLMYHVELTVSDSRKTCSSFVPPDNDPSSNCTNNKPVLYVSSSDDKWNDDWDAKMDYVVSVDNDAGIVTMEDFHFGTKQRGFGCISPDPLPDPKRWYSYDEFLTNGGIEVVYAEVEDSAYKPETPPGGSGIDYVPVQSEADILLVSAHGAGGGQFGGDFTYPDYDPDLIPSSFGGQQGWDYCHKEHYPATGQKTDYEPASVNFYGNGWGYEKNGKFWQNQPNPELRWLTIMGCRTLTDGDGNLEWKERIGNNDNFLSSVCSFNSGTNLYLCYQSLFFERYSEYMEDIFQIWSTSDNPYEPTGPCGVPNNIYFWACPRSCDISVSAFMEAAVKTIGRSWGYTQLKMNLVGLQWAAAVDKENFDQNNDNIYQHYYYTLEEQGEDYQNAKGQSFSCKIISKILN